MLLGLAASAVQRSTAEWVEVQGVPLASVLVAGLSAGAVAAGTYGLYRITLRLLVECAPTKRRRHDLRSVVRLAFIVAATARP